MGLHLSFLGSCTVLAAGGETAVFKSDKVRALLAYLALEAERPHQRATLAGLLWPEQTHSRALANLRYTLYDLRKAIGDHTAEPSYLLIDRNQIQFNQASNHWLDVSAFQNLQAQTEIAGWEQALDLYKGRFLDGFFLADALAFEEWVSLERERLERQYVALLQQLAHHYQQQNDSTEAARYVTRRLEIEPWNEEAHRQLMTLLARQGQRSAALAQYETCRRVLQQDLGVEPTRQTTALYERIRAADPEPPSANSAGHQPDFAALLADYFDHIGVQDKTTDYLLEAGKRAALDSAGEEAIALLTSGLAFLDQRPDSPEQKQKKVQFYMALSGSLIANRGWGVQERIDVLNQAYALAQNLDALPNFVQVLVALSDVYRARGEYVRSLELGELMLAMGQQSADPIQLFFGHYVLGATSLFQGDLRRARKHLTQGLTIYQAQFHRLYTAVLGINTEVLSLIWLSWALCILGRPATAVAYGRQALTVADKIDHPLSQAFALAFGVIVVHLLRREEDQIAPFVARLAQLAAKHNLVLIQPWVAVFRGVVKAHEGHVDDGIALVRQGVDAWADMGSVTGRPFQLMLLADLHTQMGDFARAKQTLDEAIALTEGPNGAMYQAEILRRKGVLLATKMADGLEGKRLLRAALTLAQEQGVRWWALRTAVSLVRLQVRRGGETPARAIVADLYSRFTEGFAARDLTEARQLLP